MRFTLFLAAAATLACMACASAQDNSKQPFGAWLSALRQEAAQQGISDTVLNEALNGVEPIDRVLELDQAQPEVTLTLPQYLKQVLTKKMLRQAREHYRDNRDLLKKIGAQYGVQPQYIVALWGIETHYGSNMGNTYTVGALATLAYDGRRSDYFRGELLNALQILQQGHIAAHDMQGSWAGAMGQCQFMPSSFLKYAVDYDGDGRKDIWHSKADVFASIANYLHSEGWNPKKGWGTRTHPKDNFNVLLKWNRSRYFATAAGQLADSIVKGKK